MDESFSRRERQIMDIVYRDNETSAREGVVVGGRYNKATTGQANVVVGGFGNETRGNDSTICGGQQNLAVGVTSAIAGGANGQTTAAAQAGTVLGGNGVIVSTVTGWAPSPSMRSSQERPTRFFSPALKAKVPHGATAPCMAL